MKTKVPEIISLNLDLSTVSTGWSIIKNGKLFKYGKITPSVLLSPVEKLVHIKDVLEFLLEINPDVNIVVIEDVFFVRNQKTFAKLCEIQGVVKCLSYLYVGNNVFSFPATHVRSCFDLKTKKEVYEYVKNILNGVDENWKFKTHNDITDSILLGLSILKNNKTIKTKKMLEKEKELNEPLEIYLIREYWEHEKSLKDISKILKVSYSALHKWFQDLKIQIRERAFSGSFLPTKLTEEQEQLIMGSVLGDGGLYRSKRANGYYGNYCFQVSHSSKFREYVEYKQNILYPFSKHIIDYDGYNKKTKKYYPKSQLRTYCVVVFNKYADLFYNNNIKVVRPEVLNKLKPQGIAFWFMDDGSNWKNDEVGRRRISLATHSFTKQENELISKWFNEKYGIKFNVTKAKDLFYLNSGDQRNIKRFIAIIKEYVPDIMKYKLKTYNKND